MASSWFLFLALIPLVTSSAIPPTYVGQTLKWTNCPSSLDFLQHIVQCAEVQVPLDYENPKSAGTITIGVTRLPAIDTKNRIGNLFYNPGGPGDLASEALNSSALVPQAWHKGIRERFDIIGVDLRGTGLSSPILYDQNLFAQRYNMLPTNAKEFEKLRQRNIALRESSIKMTGSRLIDFMDTATIAKDHEVVRSALGEEQLTWLGQSGGTQLGERYAELFPDNIRAMVLDAVVAQSQVGVPAFIENALSVDATMKVFFKWCEQQNATVCPAAHGNKTIETVWIDLLARAEASPLPIPGCTVSTCVNNDVTAQEIRNAARMDLYKPYNNESGFATLAAGIYQLAILHNATALATMKPSNTNPPYATSTLYAENVIECNDRINDDTWVSMRSKAVEAQSSTPLFAGITDETAFESACVGWPTLGRNPPHAIDIPHSAKLPVILMASNLYDPGTPYSWGTVAQQEIGDARTRRVTRLAAGHTIFFQPEANGGQTVEVMVDYLLNLQLPKQGATFAN